MTDMAVHTYIVHPRHLINIAILSQQLQMCVLSFFDFDQFTPVS